MDYSDHGGGLGHDAGRSVAGARRRPAGWPFRRGPADELIDAGSDPAQPVELAAVLEHVTDAIGVLSAEGGF
ncbi:MAG TPA: hypothetical protein VGR90_01815, partial [Acidimicrobiales bacterium]|nr:hypothetical protein [Acidimicrobiales bacterium]